MELSTFKTDKSKENDGVWFEVDADGASVLVARAGNKKYAKLLEKITKPHRHALKSRNVSDELVERLMVEAMVGTILLDWKGLELDGKPLPYSPETAKEMLQEIPDFRRIIEDYSNDINSFKNQDDEEDLKN
jgi:hypothetical protein